MKKLVALLLALLMVASCVSALAYYDEDTYDEKTKKGTWKLFDDDGTLIRYTEYSNDGKGWRDEYYEADGSLTGVSYVSDAYSVSMNPDGKIEWGEITDGKLTATYNSDDGKWYDEKGKEVSSDKVSKYVRRVKDLLAKSKAKSIPRKWYTDNTVSVVGLSLRDEYPTLTKKWYNVLPVDLSQDGVQTFDIAASNVYYMGTVTVKVDGDNVTTTYAYPSGRSYWMEPLSECLMWFTGIEEITSAFLENPTSEMKFGAAISKEKDLNGQDAAILFICNHLTYRTPLNDYGAMPTRFWRNHYKLDSFYANARVLLQKVEAEYAERQTAETKEP